MIDKQKSRLIFAEMVRLYVQKRVTLFVSVEDDAVKGEFTYGVPTFDLGSMGRLLFTFSDNLDGRTLKLLPGIKREIPALAEDLTIFFFNMGFEVSQT